MIMRNLLLLALITLLWSTSAFSQNDEDFDKFKREYYNGLEDLRNDYKRFVEQNDKEFAEYIQKEWQQFQLFKAEYASPAPGPDVVPVYKKLINVEPVRRIQPSQIQLQTKTIEMAVEPMNPIPAITSADKDLRDNNICFDFYGTHLCIPVPDDMRSTFSASVDEQNFASYWKKMSDSGFDAPIVELLRVKSNLNLNDYAMYLLVNELGTRATKDRNSATLFSWFVLTKMGYKIRLAYHSKGVSLLVPVFNQLYGFSYLTFGGVKYYMLDGTTGAVKTYEKDYPAANQIMNFNLYKPPSFDVDTLTRNIGFSFDSKQYNIKVLYNKNLIDFYSSYPQCYIWLYFDAGVSEITKESLATELWPIMKGMPEKDAASFLLKMVQTGFSYKTDQEQFGKEKYFFPEEILHYEACDCEDRSVFFAYIINELLDLPVISLNYPQHVSTAVCFTSMVNGDLIQYDNRRFTVCDPTYINAPVGATMPQFKKSKFSIISPSKRSNQDEQEEFVWEKIYKAGGFKGSDKTILISEDSSCLIAGFFTDTLTMNGRSWVVENENTGVFVARLDKYNKPLWVSTFATDGSISLQNIIISSDRSVYVSGEFGKNLYFDKKKLVSSSVADQFAIKFNKDGELEWQTSIRLDSIYGGKPFFLQVTISDRGDVKGLTFVEEFSYNPEQTLFLNTENDLVIIAERGVSESGLKISPELGLSGNYELLETWKKLTDKYISMHYDKSIAGFFALMETLQNSSLDISGKEMMASLNTLNPSFKNNYKNFYSSLQYLTRISSRNGIVTFYTSGGKVLKCGPLSIVNGARAQMRDYKSGNKQVKVLNGIYYDSFFRSLRVNYLKCFKVNGDIMIDYDNEHYQKVVNTQTDILKQ